MAGLFERLFGSIIGRGKGMQLTDEIQTYHKKKSAHETKSGSVGGQFRSRETIADDIQRETREGFDSLNKQIAAGRDLILAQVEKKFQDAQKKLEEDHAKNQAQPQEPWAAFVYHGMPLIRGINFASTNVERMLYDIASKSLFVEFYTGWFYRYWPIDEREAASVFNSTSKGTWVWDNLRIRGTKLGHRKNYQLVGHGATLPKWTASQRSRQGHDTQVAAESGATEGFEVLGLGNTGPSLPYSAIGRFALQAPRMNIGNKETAKEVLKKAIKDAQA